MARSFEVSDRVVLLLSMIPFLRDHGPIPVTELAERFSVDASTVRKLIAFLGTAGIPGETHTYQAEDLFDIDWDALELEDTVSLTQIVAVDDTPRFSATEYAALLAGLHSLQGLLSGEQAQLAAATAAKLALAAPASGAARSAAHVPISVTADPVDPQLSTVTEALNARHRLAFTYQDLRGHSSVRQVEPLALTQSQTEWYLRGYCLDRGAERTFLISAMRDTRDTGEPTERSPLSAAAVLGPQEAELPARVLIRAAALHSIAGFAPSEIEEAEPGWLRVSVLLEHPQSAVRLVQASPGDIVIESPDAAREAVAAWAARALAPYDR